jgi:hypothetical protein
VNRSRVETIEGMQRVLAVSAKARCIEVCWRKVPGSTRWDIYELGQLVEQGHKSIKAAHDSRMRRAADLGVRIWRGTCSAHGVSEIHGWHYCTEYFDAQGHHWAGGWYSGTTLLGASAPCIVAAWAMRGGGE